MNKQESILVIDLEIDWCKKNPDDNLDKEFQKGFIAGLVQAKILLNQLEDDE